MMLKRVSRQAGYLLVEVAIALALSGILLTYKIKEASVALIDDVSKAQGQQVKTLGDALNNYAVTYHAQVIGNTPVAGIAAVRTPTVAELITKGFLPSNFSTTAYNGSGFLVSLSESPSGCTLESASCQVTGYASLAAPFNINGAFSPRAVGGALLAMGADGGVSMLSGATIVGINNGWSMANPVAGQPKGILAVRVGAGASSFLALLPRDGSRRMMAPITFDASSVQTEGAACTTGSIGRDAGGNIMSCISSVWTVGKWKDPVANKATLDGAYPCNATRTGEARVVYTPSVGSGPRAYTCDGATWQPLAVDDNGNLAIPGSVGVGASTISSVGAVCVSGAVAKTAAGAILYCDTNTLTYRQASTGELVANTVQIAGVVTEGAACPNGTADNGRVARDSTGLLLSCQSGSWAKQGMRFRYQGMGLPSFFPGGIVCTLVGGGYETSFTLMQYAGSVARYTQLNGGTGSILFNPDGSFNSSSSNGGPVQCAGLLTYSIQQVTATGKYFD